MTDAMGNDDLHGVGAKENCGDWTPDPGGQILNAVSQPDVRVTADLAPSRRLRTGDVIREQVAHMLREAAEYDRFPDEDPLVDGEAMIFQRLTDNGVVYE